MATTWIKPIHRAKGRSVAATLADRIGYADNPDKTNSYEFVKSYGCDYYTAANEFALSKEIYEQHTGRGDRNGDIIAYHVRQSFKPGEITPQEALEVGYALMEKFTHGRHQFVVAVHTDKQHIHCHCIFSAVNMDCDRKFRNPIRSMKIVRQISDFLCAERGLSIVENPKPSRGSYRDWQDKKEPQSNRDKLQEMIDAHISAGMVFEQFIGAMHYAGCEVKRGKYLSFTIPGAERFIRVKSIGEDYTEEALRERCLGKRTVAPKPKTFQPQKINLVIDLQQKLQEGKTTNYMNWAKCFNLQQAAKALIYLQEHKLLDYDLLTKTVAGSSTRHRELLDKIKADEKRMAEIKELQKYIGAYGKTKDIYKAYRNLKSQKDRDAFYNVHATDIILCQAAKKHFDELGMTKLPSINQLKQEYAILAAGMGKQYAEYKQAKQKMADLHIVKQNVDWILDGPIYPPKTHERGALTR